MNWKIKQNSKRRTVLFIGGILCLFAACGVPEKQSADNMAIKPSVIPAETATPTLSPTPAADPTITEPPTNTPLPTATPTPTSTPTPTVTPTPTPSPTPVWRGTEGEVSFSEAGYFFEDTVLVELSLSSDKEGYITYTMDGSEPQQDGTRYETPFLLEGTEEVSPRVYAIRAKAWYVDGTSSDSYVHTYFVGEKVAERYSTMVFSIVGNPEELTEGPDGILYGENYLWRGRESERKVHMEAISSD